MAAEILAALLELVGDLPRTEQNPPNVAGLDPGGIGNHALEGARREIRKRRHAPRMPEEALRGHDYQRLPPGAEHLPAEEVEDLGRRCRRDNLDVVLGRQRQEPLEAGARMLRPLPFEAVRQEHHEPREPVPLVFGADDELVNDDLGTVDEVAELRLPHDKPVRAVEAVAVLEAEHSCLRQRAVVDFDRRLIGGEVLERAVGLVAHAVVDHGMAVAERAPLAVLPGETHPHPLGGE